MTTKNYLSRPDLDDCSGLLGYLTTPQEETEIYKLMQTFVNRPEELSISWLKENQYIAVPCPESIDQETAKRFTKIVGDKLKQPLFGVSLQTGNDPLYQKYTVKFKKINSEAMFMYDFKFNPWNWIVFSKSRKLVILQVEIGWYVIAGQRDFVELNLNQSVEQAQNEFYEHAQFYINSYSDGYFTYLGEKLLATHEFYKQV